MPKFPKPFYRTTHSAWLVQIAGKQVNLGPDQDAAFRRYHELMREPKPAPPVASDAVLGVLNAFLDWCQKHKAAHTYDWYRDYLESFARTIPAGLTIAQLKPYHVQQWVDANAGWKTGKRGAVIAVQRAFNWAVRIGLIDANPVRSIEKPKAGRRDQVITVGEYQAILSHIKDTEFRELIVTCWETGCRPQEALAVEAGPCRSGQRLLAFPGGRSQGQEVPACRLPHRHRPRHRPPADGCPSGRAAVPQHRRPSVDCFRAQLPLQPAPPHPRPQEGRRARPDATQAQAAEEGRPARPGCQDCSQSGRP